MAYPGRGDGEKEPSPGRGQEEGGPPLGHRRGCLAWTTGPGESSLGYGGDSPDREAESRTPA